MDWILCPVGEGRKVREMANLDLNECFRVADQVAREAGTVSIFHHICIMDSNVERGSVVGKKLDLILVDIGYLSRHK